MLRKDHKDLIVWQKAMDLAYEVHVSTSSLPRDELFGITAQLRKAAISVPSNIAEGAARASTREFIHFLHIARGSLAELETQFELAQRFGYIDESSETRTRIVEVGKLINAVIRGLRRRLSTERNL